MKPIIELEFDLFDLVYSTLIKQSDLNEIPRYQNKKRIKLTFDSISSISKLMYQHMYSYRCTYQSPLVDLDNSKKLFKHKMRKRLVHLLMFIFFIAQGV